ITDLPKRGVYYQGGEYNFRNDTFIACAEGAIHVAYQSGQLRSRITDSYFRWNYGVLSGWNNSTTILNSTFVYNSGPAVLSLTGNDTVSCCRFRYNAAGPVIEFSGNTDSSSVIHNNLIEYNVNNNPSAWNGASVFYMTGFGHLYISNNTIRHNS